MRRAANTLNCLSKKGITYSSSKNKFVKKKKSIEEMVCFKCGKLGHLANECRYNKSKSKDKKDRKPPPSDELRDDEKKKRSFNKKKNFSRRKFVNKQGRAYIGEWVIDEESSEVSSISYSLSDDSDEEVIVGLAIATPTKAKSSPSTTPSKPLCLMAKSDKVRTFDDSSSDDDDAPSYEELASLIKDQDKALKRLKKENKSLASKIIDGNEQDSTLKTKLEALQEENKSLKQESEEVTLKYDNMCGRYNSLEAKHKELKVEHESAKNDLSTLDESYNKLKITFTSLN